MLQELKFQLSTAILTILTVAAAVSAGINFSQQFRFHLPDDGVTWVDHAGPNGISTVQAFRVAPDSGADNAGVRTGDILRKINTLPIKKAVYVPQALATIGVWNKADYWVERGGVEFKTSVIIAAVPRDPIDLQPLRLARRVALLPPRPTWLCARRFFRIRVLADYSPECHSKDRLCVRTMGQMKSCMVAS